MAAPMDLLQSNLSRVRIPEPTSCIHTQECCVSFDTPRSEGGLYVDMNTFLAFGKEALIWNYEKTGNPVYLHIIQTKKLFPEEDRPLKKPMPFPIGVDEYEESYSIVVLPEHVNLPFPSVDLPDKVRLAVDAIVIAHQVAKSEAERKIGHQELEPVFCPGYTGFVNVRFSPYFAAVMQVLFSTQPFCSRYYTNQSLKTAFEMASADPTVDLNMQLTKLGHGLLSGKYSTPSKEGIPPQMLKKAIETAIDPRFSTMWRHDALLFFKLFMGGVKRANAANPELDPSRSFSCHIEDRVLSKYGIPYFRKWREYWLSLSIPLDEATNKEEVKAYHKLRDERFADGKEISDDEIVRPRVPLEACLAKFSAPQEIDVIHMKRKKKNTKEIWTSALASFPDYLVLHMLIFVQEAGRVVEMLDVYVDVPEVIDISHLRSSDNEVLNDGGGKYRLIGVVSHVPGTARCHYVAHIYKDGRRVTFDGNKVTVISPPPKDDDLTTGYLYFFERLNNHPTE